MGDNGFFRKRSRGEMVNLDENFTSRFYEGPKTAKIIQASLKSCVNFFALIVRSFNEGDAGFVHGVTHYRLK